jgi:peptidoglycan/LPS O-acetylase OafA/YrhL
VEARDLAGKRSQLRGAALALPPLFSVPVRSGHVAYLDGWRGICILLVLIGHYVAPLRFFGRTGVEFFFVLSGSLMADLLVFRRQEIGPFLRRRIARVFPALAVYVALIGTALNLSLALEGQPLRLASPLAALFYVHNYLPEASVVQLFEHTWSLAVEEHSYLLLVGIVIVARRRPLLAALLALMISALAVANAYRLLAVPYSGGQWIFWRSDVRAASVLISFALCILFRRMNPDRLPGWFAAGAAIVAAIGMVNRGDSPIQLASCTVLAALAVNSLGFCSRRSRAMLEAPILVWFGTLSFSIYVWQQMFAVFAKSGWPPLPCLALTLASALMSFKLVENPARDFLNAHWGARRIRSSAAVPPQRAINAN